MAHDNTERIHQQLELLDSLSDVVQKRLSLLLPREEAWQPTDYLPDFSAGDWVDQVNAYRTPAQELSDEVLVVLVGDMVTEEALPNYAIALNLVVRDEQGDSDAPWAQWLRGWVAEENRHGDLLNAYLRLTGRVDMRAVEVTVHNLIADGFNPRTSPDPYASMVYTSFQERATKVSHFNVGKLAEKSGDANLAKICKKIAGDESRHERFYTLMMGEVMQRDPQRGVQVFRDMMRKIIAMPGRLMDDGKDPDLFEHFSAVAQRLGVYTAFDYAEILKHLVGVWKIGTHSVTGRAAAAQDYLCGQAEKLLQVADMITEKAVSAPRTRFSWIHDRMA